MVSPNFWLIFIVFFYYFHFFFQDFYKCDEATVKNATVDYIKLTHGLLPNYTAKSGERIRLECEFEASSTIDTIYWIRNLEEIIQPVKGKINIIRKNQSTTLIFRKLDSLDKGSYSCYAENSFGNVTSETMLNIIDTQFNSNKKLR
jgi:hypothetical protein